MSEQSSAGEKTEEATPKKRSDARNRGEIPRSMELNSALILLGGALTTLALAPALGGTVRSIFEFSLLAGSAGEMDLRGAATFLQALGWRLAAGLGAFLTIMAGVALFTAGVQARGVLTVKPLEPKWSRLDPLKNIKQQYGSQAIVEFVKSIVKVLVVAIVIRGVAGNAWAEMLDLVSRSPFAVLEVVRRHAVRLLLYAGYAYLVLAALDYAYQVWKNEKDLRMTKQEVKDEMKQSEGDPMVKARMRSMGRSLARRRMFQDVPLADVVITNPTHIAIALRYDPELSLAPVVVAVGQRKIAERIKAIAAENEVPMVENRPLARALLRTVQVGMAIPPEFYVAVAEVLAFVIRERPARRTRRTVWTDA